MARPKKDVVKVTFSIDKDVNETLDKYSNETFIPKARIVTEAIKEYISKRNKKHD